MLPYTKFNSFSTNRKEVNRKLIRICKHNKLQTILYLYACENKVNFKDLYVLSNIHNINNNNNNTTATATESLLH